MPKRIVPLSDVKIQKAKPKEKDYSMFDGGGLFILVTTTGGKLWRLKYRFNKKQKLLAFGSYPGITLQEAREKREEARKNLANGLDPGEIKKKEKAQNKAERFEAKGTPSVLTTFDGKIEIWKGSNTMRLTLEEARFIASLLTNITR